MSLYSFGRVVVSVFFRVFYRLRINGRENIPDESERFIICSNHKSNLDPPLVGLAVPFQTGFMAKEELFKFKPFGALISKLGAFPIKRGKTDFGALRSAIHMVESGKHIVIFPEGGRSHGDRLRKGKMGAVMIAVKSKANILPIGIEGSYKPFTRLTVNIGEAIDLSEYFELKQNSRELQEVTDKLLMPRISELSNTPLRALESGD